MQLKHKSKKPTVDYQEINIPTKTLTIQRLLVSSFKLQKHTLSWLMRKPETISPNTEILMDKVHLPLVSLCPLLSRKLSSKYKFWSLFSFLLYSWSQDISCSKLKRTRRILEVSSLKLGKSSASALIRPWISRKSLLFYNSPTNSILLAN